jgi:hypothetical protein
MAAAGTHEGGDARQLHQRLARRTPFSQVRMTYPLHAKPEVGCRLQKTTRPNHDNRLIRFEFLHGRQIAALALLADGEQALAKTELHINLYHGVS